MATANWTRGLFRLWIVLSALWVVFIVTAMLADPCPVMMRVPEEIWNPPPRPPSSAVGPEAANFLEACWQGGRSSPVIDVIGPLRIFVGPMPTIYGYALLAFAAPAATFLLGAAAKWIVAGFKSLR